jgi:hypothetical protein
VSARGGERWCPPRDRPQVQEPKYRGHQRADQADADEPVGTVDQIRQALRPGPGEDVEDQRRYERPDRQRDQQGIEGMAFGTRQQDDSYNAEHPARSQPAGECMNGHRRTQNGHSGVRRAADLGPSNPAP